MVGSYSGAILISDKPAIGLKNANKKGGVKSDVKKIKDHRGSGRGCSGVSIRWSGYCHGSRGYYDTYDNLCDTK